MYARRSCDLCDRRVTFDIKLKAELLIVLPLFLLPSSGMHIPLFTSQQPSQRPSSIWAPQGSYQSPELWPRIVAARPPSPSTNREVKIENEQRHAKKFYRPWETSDEKEDEDVFGPVIKLPHSVTQSYSSPIGQGKSRAQDTSDETVFVFHILSLVLTN